MTEMIIQGMHACPRQGLPVLLLKEVESGRYLNIRLPDAETQLLTCVLVGVPTPYERTCRLLASTLKRHGPLSHVEIHFEDCGTITARLGVMSCHGPSLLELHPAEALTVAWGEGLPIRAACAFWQQEPPVPVEQHPVEEDHGSPDNSLPPVFRDLLAQLELGSQEGD